MRPWSSLLAAAVALAIVAGTAPIAASYADGPAHLVFSEVATGGASASDEFIELHNPWSVPLPLAGLEVAYVSASGATVSQRAAWPAEAAHLAAGDHLLLANEAGQHASIADVLYRGGLSDAGGTLVLRVTGAAAAIDAVGWGTAAGTWPEGTPAPAPRPGFSLERTRDTDDNASDFVEASVPTPQAATAASSPELSPTPSPDLSASAEPPVPQPSSSPGVPSLSIAAARVLPNGSVVTVEGLAITGSDFHDGGGYLHDEGSGIAVIVEDGSFVAGSRLRITGTTDDRFAQRTIRASATDIHVLVDAPPVDPVQVATGVLGEALEGRLVKVSAAVRSGPTALAAGLAFDIDDGSGSARVVVGSTTGVDTGSWGVGAMVDLVGVLGQRDSSGTGTSGYRLQPRSAADVLRVSSPSPTPGASSSSTSAPTPTPAPGAGALATIRDARAAASGTPVMVSGVVTMPPGIVDAETAVIQDSTAAIVLRLGDGSGALRRGDLVEVHGTRSTKAGMETLRVTSETTVVAVDRHVSAAPVALSDVGEPIEAQLVVVRGTLLESARRAPSGTVSFEIEDGSGTARVVLPASLHADDSALVSGASVEATGVVGQDTPSAEPAAGYRIWPRSVADLRVLGTPVEPPPGRGSGPAGGDDGASPSSPGGTAEATGTHDGLDAIGLGDIRVGATLVAGPWHELAIGGLLWDGERLVAIASESAALLAPLGPARPLTLELSGLRRVGVEPTAGVPLVALDDEPAGVARGTALPRAPRTEMPGPGEPAAWVTLVGDVSRGADPALDLGVVAVALDIRCAEQAVLPPATMSVTGIGVGARDGRQPRVIVPCDGFRAAPTLARMLGDEALPGPIGSDPAATIVAVPPEALADPRRGQAAALLATGLLALAAAAFVARRFADKGERATNPDLEEEGVNLGPPEVGPLSLVRLRREGPS